MAIQWLRDLANRFRGRKIRASVGNARRTQLFVEPLEDRVLLATQIINVGRSQDALFLVNPSGAATPVIVGEPYSLREAIVLAHQSSADTVVINLQPGAAYNIERPTTPTGDGIFVPTEDTFRDLYYGDFDISRNLIINGNGAFIRGESLGRVFQVKGNATVTLRDMTVLNGGGSEIREGAGIHVSGGANLTLDNVRVYNNVTGLSDAAKGGGLYIDNAGGTVIVNGGEFDSNAARGAGAGQGAGGAIYLKSGRLEVNGTDFEFNLAQGGNGTTAGAHGVGASGGGIYVESGDVQIVGARFKDNNAVGGDGVSGLGSGVKGGDGGIGRGGAIYFGGSGRLDIDTTEFVGNEAWGGRSAGGNLGGGRGGEAYGGAIFLSQDGYRVTIEDSLFTSNEAFARGMLGQAFQEGGRGGTAKGGAIATDDAARDFMTGFLSTLDVERSIFRLNQALGGNGGSVENIQAGLGGDAYGGAVYARYGTMNFTDTAFLENRASAGIGGFATVGQGGNGGEAAGGAIYTAGYVQLNLTGHLETDGAEQLASTTLIYGNSAMGGSGGGKNSVANDSSLDGPGHGGNAHGGAIAATGGLLSVREVLLMGNVALAGNGARGFVTAHPDAAGTAGGTNGTARGGALYTTIPSTVVDSAFLSNAAAGARLDQAAEGDGTTVDAAALAAGAAGRNDDGKGLNGGNGGAAFGGAVFTASDLTVTGSGFTSNQAIGSMGGAGSASGPGEVGGHGGRGGDAAGGGIRAETSGTVRVLDSTFIANYVQAGRGGSGGRGGDGGAEGYRGGSGGRGGDAEGGAISVISPLTMFGNLATVELQTVYVHGNMAVAGDGGFAGSGGGGAEFGGDGGVGGRGGDARGGGVHLSHASTTIDRTTVEANIVSSGFGAAGGYGGGGNWGGGWGGTGGQGGLATGGGIARMEGTLSITRSTIVFNQAVSGFGGNGGFGGVGKIGGGGGGFGGRGGNAEGGGLYSTATDFNPAQVSTTTIVGNILDAGGKGFGAPATPKQSQMNSLTPMRYDAPASQPILNGAASVLSGRLIGGLGGLSTDYTFSSGGAGANLGADGIDAGTLVVSDALGYFSGGGTALGGLSVGAAIGILGAIGTKIVSGTVLIEAVGGTTVTAVTFSASSALFVTGAFSAGAVVLAIGATVLVKALVAGALSGDWEGAFAYALGSPGNVYPRNFGILLTGVQQSDDDDIPTEILTAPGADGAKGEVSGTGVWGLAALDRTVVSDNSAYERERSRQVGPVILENHGGLIIIGESSFGAYFLSEAVHARSVTDVGGGAFGNGTNFIGAVNSGFTNDLKGTTANPLSAKPDTRTGFHGGAIPTLKLLPGSPARRALTVAAGSVSQNGFTWGTTADIGAWGAVANRAPLAAHGPFYVGANGSRTVALGSDPDNDPLTLVGTTPTASNGAVTINGNLLTYTPAVGFTGIETVTYQVTDGEFTRTVTTTFEVIEVKVTDVQVHGLASEPPQVTGVTLTFSHPVSLSSGAIRLRREHVTWFLSNVQTNGNQVTAQFTGLMGISSSVLPSGNYTLIVIDDLVNGPNGIRPLADFTHSFSTLPALTSVVTSATANYSGAGQSVTVSSQLNGPNGPPTNGNVVFRIQLPSGTIATASAMVNALGVASASFTLPANTDAGIYAIETVYTNGTAYRDHTSTNSNGLTVNRAVLTVAADSVSKTYGQTASLTGAVQGIQAGDSITASYSSTGTAATANVGMYAIAAVLSDNGSGVLLRNYTVASNLANVGTLTVTPAAVTVTANAGSKTYGDADPVLSYQITSGNLFNGDIFTGSLNRAAGENVGQYAIGRGTLNLSNNYALTYVGSHLTIHARAITITADFRGKIYGDADPTLTHRITSGNLVFGDALTGELARASGENVGSYLISQGTLSAGGNYALTYVSNQLTISPRPIRVMAMPQTKVYGNADPVLNYGILNGNLVFGDQFTGRLTRAAGENAGSYVIGQGTLALSSNYALTFVSSNLWITPRTIIVAADAKSKNMGEADPVLTYRITYGSLVAGDQFSGGLSRQAGETVGIYAINLGTLTAGSNYTLSFSLAYLTILGTVDSSGNNSTTNSRTRR